MKWIPILKYSPDAGYQAICYFNGRVKELTLTDRISKNTNYQIWIDCYGEEVHTVTHWIPYIQPPYKEVNPYPKQK